MTNCWTTIALIDTGHLQFGQMFVYKSRRNLCCVPTASHWTLIIVCFQPLSDTCWTEMCFTCLTGNWFPQNITTYWTANIVQIDCGRILYSIWRKYFHWWGGHLKNEHFSVFSASCESNYFYLLRGPLFVGKKYRFSNERGSPLKDPPSQKEGIFDKKIDF